MGQNEAMIVSQHHLSMIIYAGKRICCKEVKQKEKTNKATTPPTATNLAKEINLSSEKENCLSSVKSVQTMGESC